MTARTAQQEQTIQQIDQWNDRWQLQIRALAFEAMKNADPGHGIDHVVRVVKNASAIAATESADAHIVLPSAWLHDCVLVPKNSSQRSSASRLAADHAVQLLEGIQYPGAYLIRIHHAVLAHSFSANVPCESLEAQVLQDADRLEALGAIGIARCLMTTGHLRQDLYNIDEPFPVTRIADDRQFAIDHFFCKLLRLPATMKTITGRSLAEYRLQIMNVFLESLCNEIGSDPNALSKALHNLVAA